MAAGSPIPQVALYHWMTVAAKSESQPGVPTIVPTDPPAFKGCISQVRHQIPSLKRTSAKTLTSDCAQLYRSLSTTAMDFLIKADWVQAEEKYKIDVPTWQIATEMSIRPKAYLV